MNSQKMSYDLKINGTLLSMPTELHMGMQKGQLALQGTMQTNQMNLTKLIAMIDSDIAGKYDTYLCSLTKLFPEKLSFYYEGQQCMIWSRSKSQQFGVMWKNKDIAVLYAMECQENDVKGSAMYYVTMVANALGIQKIFLYLKKGTSCNISTLTNMVMGNRQELQIPVRLSDYNLLFCGFFSFDKETIIGQAMQTLFGIGETKLNLFLVAGEQKCTGLVRLPTFECGVLKAQELYFGVDVKNQEVQMGLSGTFLFSFLEGVTFRIECQLSNQGFRIEAFAKMEQPKPLFHTFSIGDTCLAIGYQRGFLFQMFCNLYMGKIKLFGAIGLCVNGSVVTIDLLSAAVTDITLPIFVESALGKKINGLEEFNFIELLGLPFAQTQKFPLQKNMTRMQVAEAFNAQVSDPSFMLDATQVEVEAFQEGLIVVDKKRMRHYCITKEGVLQLQAQFYFATKDMELGDYTIAQGIFLCATIRLFQKIEVQALFSMSDKDGVIAYACIRNFDLGFLKLTASELTDAKDNPLSQLPEKSLLRQFITPEEKGAVFYLRAGANEVSFYIDGKLELLNVFQFAARILYVKGLVSVDAKFSLAVGIEAALHIGVSYLDFSKANFSFSLEIDCTGLEKKLRQVQENINHAIDELKNKINSAKQKLTEAQNHVNELYGQIASLDRKIDGCKYEISHAKWYKKAFVAIAKGVEIAAYEVAKAGLYAAIGVANAALELAKQVVSLSGKVGEGVLKAISGAIDATLNLFFVRLVRLEASVSLAEQYFEAEIEFVALGKTYHYQTKIGKKAISENPANALSTDMNKKMDTDLQNIENGSYRSNRNRYRHDEYTIAQNKTQLKDGMQHLQAATRMMCRMQNAYVDGCGETMPEFEAMNVSYQQAVNGIAGMLDLANRSVDFTHMDQAVSMLEEEMDSNKELSRDTTFQPVKEAISDYKESAELLQLIQESIGVVEQQSISVEKHMENMKQNEEQYQKAFIENGTKPDCDMVSIINKTEEMMYEEFPVTRNKKGLINLSREKRIHQYLDEARMEFGGEQTEKIKNMRVRAAKGNYESRL